MATCEHITWLQVSGSEDLTLHNEGRLTRLLAELIDPEAQKPSLFLFLGHRAKNLALRQLFPYNNIKRGQQDGIANLRIDTSTLNSDYPILFADSNPASRPLLQAKAPLCHEVRSYGMSSRDRSTLFDFLHARLFCMFSDVICIFAEDFPSLDSVVERLKAWAALGSASHISYQLRPRVVIVVESDNASPTYSLLQAQDLRFNLHQQELISFFSSITVLHLANAQISPLARYRRLKEVLLRHADEMRQLRQAMRSLFSASHLNRFFEEMVQQAAEGPHLPRNFLHISRQYNRITDEYCDHLVNFLRTCGEVIDCEEILAITATSMLMDAYPPGMHVFDPGLVYDQLYQPYWLKAITGLDDTVDSIEDRSRCLRDRFVSKFDLMMEHGVSPATLHLESLRKAAPLWERLKSNRTCLSCFRRMPENVLSCGHAFCDVCIRIFGTPVGGSEYRYKLKKCILCGLGSITKTFKPPTASARILSVDGGGVRGVVPLEFLRMLQTALGAACPIQDLFDLALGTSSGKKRQINQLSAVLTDFIGGLIVLSLFLHRWSIGQCSQIFDTLTKQFFHKEKQCSGSFVKRVRRIVNCWISDGCYDVDKLEAALQLKFGEHQKVFDYTHHLASTKVAVTATLISDAFPVIFSNYNGAMARSKDCGYKHLRPEDTVDETCVWEAGRATSAAPVLFKPIKIAGVGLVQDGGLAHNNPVSLAEWESRQIWPQNKRPDVVLSLGTGTSERSLLQDESRLHNVVKNGFVPRLWRSFMSSLDGQRAWINLLNRLDDQSRGDYFRLNVCLPGEDLAMDDTASMDDLRSSVHLQPSSHRDCTEVAAALLVSCFFFELTKPPVYDSGLYHCEGWIRCRLSSNTIFDAFMRIKQASWTFTIDTEVLGHYSPEVDRCPSCPRYGKAVRFRVRHPSDLISIHMRDLDQRQRKLSGFPESISWFVSQQHMDADFGTPHHGSASSYSDNCCPCKGPALKRRAGNIMLHSPKRIKLVR